MHRKRQIVLIVAMCVALMASACSTKKSTTEAGSGSPGSTTETTAGDGSTITVAGVGTAQGFDGIEDGVKARLKRENDAGGVLGHPIDFLGFTDDGGTSDANSAAIKELVQQKHVDAIMPLIPVNVAPQSAQFALDENVPMVGPGFGAIMCGNDATFSFNGCNVPGFSTASSNSLGQWFPAIVGKDSLDGVKVALVGSDAAGGDAFLKSIEGLVTDAGGEVVYSQGGVPAGATNVQTYVDGVTGADPDMVIIVTGLVEMLSLQTAIKGTGSKAALVNFSGYLPGILETQPALQNALDTSYIVTVFPSPIDGKSYSQQMDADLKAVGANASFGAIIGYSSADLYIAMLKNADGDPKKVIAATNAGFTYDPGDGGTSVTFPAAHTASATCSGLLKVNGAEYELIKPLTCI